MKSALINTTALAFASLLSAAAYCAEIFAPSFSEICAKDPKDGDIRKFSKEALLDSALTYAGLKFGDFPADGTPLTYAVKVDAISNPDYCSEFQDGKKERVPTGRCKSGAEDKLVAAMTSISGYLLKHTAPAAGPAPTIQVGYNQRPIPPLGPRLYKNDPNLTIACIGEPKPPPKKGDPREWTGDWLVRQTADDLSLGQKSEALKKAGYAGLGLNNDELTGSRSFNVEGVVGYKAIQPELMIDNAAALLFAGYKRQYVDGPNPKKVSNVENGSVGLDLSYEDIATNSGLYAVTPKIVRSFRSDTDLLTASFKWVPSIGLQPMGSPLGIGSFAETVLRPYGEVVLGHVLNDGSNRDFQESNNFGRAGLGLTWALYGVGDLWEPWSLTTTWRYQKVFDGPFDYFRRFESTLAYKFPKQDNFSLTLKHVDGRDLDTLERQQLWILGLGAKL